MLMSQAWRRLAHKTSTLGLVGTLTVFVSSIFIISIPTSASAAVTKQFSYTCSGTPFTNTQISVGLSAPDSVTAGQSFDLTVNIPTLTLATAPQATTVQATMTLTPTGGTVSDAGVKPGATVTAGQTNVPASNVVYKIAVTAGTTTKVSVKPGELKLALATAASTATTCTTTSTEVLDVPIGTGSGTGSDIVAYDCTLPSGTGTDYPADVDIKVVMTPPTSAKANEDASITWTGTIQTTGDPLKAPTGFPASSKVFATIKASGAGAPATATGEAALTSVTAGQDITTLPSVTVKVKPTTTGTVTLTAGDLAFGTSSTSPAIKCTAPTTGLKEYTFTVGNGNGTPTPTPTPTPTATPKPTTTKTAVVTVTPTSSKKKSQTPKAGADTGGGGEMGPDGRMFILTGTALIAAAAAGGLLMRRRNATRG